ncbi:MAG: HAMP domain-containing histidine kinase [Magnetococcales bacterium]|nr:HAMP domain-containing histidine kinase [Magnetococcales bacterium]
MSANCRGAFQGETHWDCEGGLRARELSARSWWFIRTRWIAAGLSAVGSLWAILPSWRQGSALVIDFRYFLAVSILLTVSNLIYTRVARRISPDPVRQAGVCRVLKFQVLTDFAILSVLTYGLGGIETPIMILFLPHIILATLFFSRLHSFLMTWVGILFAALPMILEYTGVVPTLSIFLDIHKETRVSSDPVITTGFVLGITGAFLICWYLVSEITSSLRLRERELEDAYARLKLLDTEKSQVTLRATHELKAPFAAIKSYVFTLRDGYCGDLPEQALKVVERIGDRCDLLTAKVSDIIHLSNLRTEQPEKVRMQETDLARIVAGEVDEARLLGKSRGLTVHYRPGEGLCSVLGSTEDLGTMVGNLLRNAVNYSRDGGEVEVGLLCREGRIALRIEDHGIGIPEEHLPRIFDEHFRSTNAIRHNPNSSGMGLALVREIVRLHEGDIRVSSRLGAGTEVTVTLSCASQQLPKGDDHGEDSHY